MKYIFWEVAKKYSLHFFGRWQKSTVSGILSEAGCEIKRCDKNKNIVGNAKPEEFDTFKEYLCKKIAGYEQKSEKIWCESACLTYVRTNFCLYHIKVIVGGMQKTREVFDNRIFM